jgi:hypothetical protein
MLEPTLKICSWIFAINFSLCVAIILVLLLINLGDQLPSDLARKFS